MVRTDAIQAFVSQETPIVRVHDADGAVGTGYSYTIGTGGSSIVRLLHDHLAPELIGRDAEADRGDLAGPPVPDPRHAGRRRSPRWRSPPSTPRSGTCAAVKAGLPLHVMAGGAQERVPLYTTEGGWLQLEPDALVERGAGRQGARLLRLQGQGRPAARREDVARLAAVREAVGPGFEIMVDANQAFTVDEAIRRARLYEPLDLAWLEEPLPAEDLGGHVRLAAGTTLPIAVGESIYSLSHFREYLQRGACSIVQADVARIGGITPWLKVAHLAEAFNVADLPALPDGAARRARRRGAQRSLGRIHPAARRHHARGMTVEEGHAVPPEAPGLGIAWDMEAIEGRRVHELTLLVD